MTDKMLIDGKDVAISDIIADPPGGYMILNVNGTRKLIKLDNKQLLPIVKEF